MDMFPKTLRASWDSASGESSTTGISTLNLGCFNFLILPISLGLLRGFSKAFERDDLACDMASSFEVGGFGEEAEDWMNVGLTLKGMDEGIQEAW